MKKAVIVLLILLFSIFLIPKTVDATTSEVTMVITSPAEDMSTSIHISYHTNTTGTMIEYTLESDPTYSQKIVITPTCKADQFDNLTGNVRSYNRCEAELSGLTPNTRYIYRVGKTVKTDSYHFQTAGGSSFSFLHVTDIHSYESIPGRITAANNVMAKAKQLDPNLAFTVASGDVTAYGSYYQQWVNLFDLSMMKEMAFAATPGNHDYYYYPTSGVATADNTFFNKVTYNPQNGAQTAMNSTYFFTYGNTLLISIDSEMQDQSNESLANQQQWFREVVEENRKTFIVVYTHRPFYTGDGLNASQAETMRNAWQKIFDTCGVDLVLTGHNHVYARTKRTHHAFDATNTRLGTTYITGIQLGDRYVVNNGTPMSAVETAIGGKIDGGNLIKVYEDYMDITFFNTAGEELDRFQIYDKDDYINQESLIQGIQLIRSKTSPDVGVLTIAPQTIGAVEKVVVRDESDQILLEIPYPTMTSYNVLELNLKDLEYHVSVELYYHNQSMGSSSFIFDNLRYNYGSIVNVGVNRGTSTLFWDSRLENNVVKRYEIYVDDELATTITDVSLEQYQLELLCLNQNYEIYFCAYDDSNHELYIVKITLEATNIWDFMTTSTINQFESLIEYLRGEE